MLVRRFRSMLLMAVPVFAVLALLAPADNALAQKKKKVKQAAVTDVHLAQTIQMLRQVKVTLEGADHDYGGHRAAAVRDVKAAIHQLQLTHHHLHKGKNAPKTGANVKGGGEPQALSDAQLAASVPALQQIHGALQQTTNDFGGHRAKAVTDLGKAITQLQTALQYSAVKNKNKQ